MGSHTCKIGISGEEQPIEFIPSQVAQGGTSQQLFGKDNILKNDAYDSRSFIDHGRVTDWDDMEVMLQYIYQDVLPPYLSYSSDPKENLLFITQAMNTPLRQKEKLCELAFEYV